MKSLSLPTILFVSMMSIGTMSCKKKTAEQISPSNKITPVRKVQFSLYTDQDFSSDHDTITFTLQIRKSTNTLWDSVLAPMKIKDIPNVAHKLVIEKRVPNNDSTLLKVGFLYSITNVGNSWHLDTSNAGQTFKAVDFNFQ